MKGGVRNVFVGKLIKLIIVNTDFPKLWFLLKTLSSLIGSRTRLTFFIFEKCLSSMQAWIIIVKMMFHEKKCTKCRLQFKQWHKCYPLRQPSRNIKKTCTEEVWFNQVNLFYCFVKDLWSWNANFCFVVFLVQVWQ